MTGTVQVIECPDSMRELVRAAQSNGRRVGLVPTMGALHEGHLSLVRASTTECDVTAVTIFVNPSQFGANEDLDQYPRSLENDLAALESLAVEWVFAPQTAQMYGPGFSTWISPPEIAATLEGESRPGHFRGVCTIVLKLFQILPADIVYFGQK
ncbi:MAG: pantoate--beta-alanine ligase, partial [Pirellulaceae bacterium]|nr:pantoate--beta-alanine ligase [Pirellulaceae bacterium]